MEAVKGMPSFHAEEYLTEYTPWRPSGSRVEELDDPSLLFRKSDSILAIRGVKYPALNIQYSRCVHTLPMLRRKVGLVQPC